MHKCDKERELNLIHENSKLLNTNIKTLNENMNKRFDIMDRKLEKMQAFKWKLSGMGFILGTLLTIIVSFAPSILKAKGQ